MRTKTFALFALLTGACFLFACKQDKQRTAPAPSNPAQQKTADGMRRLQTELYHVGLEINRYARELGRKDAQVSALLQQRRRAVEHRRSYIDKHIAESSDEGRSIIARRTELQIRQRTLTRQLRSAVGPDRDRMLTEQNQIRQEMQAVGRRHGAIAAEMRKRPDLQFVLKNTQQTINSVNRRLNRIIKDSGERGATMLRRRRELQQQLRQLRRQSKQV